MAPKTGFAKLKPAGQAFKDKSKPADVRSSNINAARGMSLKNVFNFFIYANSKRLTLKEFGKSDNFIENS